ncbi:MAG: hypothetical protein KAS95_06550, partial [Candidatus Heimdallarchaeota archaeon]|nr:hypothetical protein [Candidatus Heimdallarchaeota archaeon]
MRWVLIRFSEIAIKGAKTRKRFTNMLIDHLKYVLFNLFNITNLDVKNLYSRILISSENMVQQVNNIVASCIPGVVSTSIVHKTSTQTENINEIIKNHYLDKIGKIQAFAVRVKRTGNHNFSSIEFAADIGSFIYNSFPEGKLKVDLTNPEYVLHLDIRGEDTYIFDHKTDGLGGIPAGSQGNVLVLISEEEEDLANILQLYKRGANTLIYSLKSEKEYSESFLQHLQWLIKLQPALKKKEQLIYFPLENSDISNILEVYDNNKCLGIALSAKMFETYTSLFPVKIP